MGGTALILVDIQNDYFAGGLWPVPDMAQVAGRAAALLQRARSRGDLVIHIRHEAASQEAPFFRPGTEGADIHDSVAPLPGEQVILKHRPNSFHETGLDDFLRGKGITEFMLCGAMTQMCIDATARAGRDLGYAITVVSDACGAKEMAWQGQNLSAAEVQAAFLAPLAMSYATVVSLAELE